MTAAAPVRIAMVAGEASGDLLASSVLQGLRQLAGAVDAYGIGGPRMSESGFDPWWPSELLAVRGFVEVVRHYPRLWSLRNRLRERLLAERPEIFVGVDAPDFNLGLERSLRRSGLRCAQFIGPAIWAWRRERIERVRAAVDHMLLIFPFELELYREAGIAATYCGHPLADQIPLQPDRASARSQLQLPAQGSVVAVLPGSRVSELHYLGPAFIETIRWLARARPQLCFVIPAANATLRARLDALLAAAPLPDQVDLRLLDGQSHAALAAADAVLLASGTATLETALHKRPMVIAYRMAPLTYQLSRRLAYLPHIGLPNILCGERLVPEFVQDAATPQALGAAVLAQLDDDANARRLHQRFTELHHQLRRDCGRRAAQALLELREAR
ncbi:MAG TPA: lipid-A-disaccharide synthase [Burkholderiaceae bacterium]|nr:lipid-A-disaccharide synthase [Burkholderiaceae bacterium]